MKKKFNKDLKDTTNSLEELTQNEKEVLHLLTQEFFTIKQVSFRRHTSDKAVYQIVDRLVKKGYLDKQNFKALKKVPPCHLELEKDKVVMEEWRYHDLHFVVYPFSFFPRYHKIRLERGGYGINHREWVIKLHEESVEIQLQQFQDFVDVDKYRATRKAEDSFNRVLREVSNKFGFCVFKDGRANIKLVNEQLAKNPSSVAEASKFSHLLIKDVFDGKVWFVIDNSKGLEHEYTKPNRVLSDAEKVEPYFNDFKDKQPLKNSDLEFRFMQLLGVVESLAKQNGETAIGLKMITKLLESQLKVSNIEHIEDSKVNKDIPDYIN